MIDFAGAAQELELLGIERADHIERMRANPSRHPPEAVRIAEGRMRPFRDAFLIVRAVASTSAIRDLVEQQLSVKEGA
jgi:hypothetical protein